MNLWEKMGKVQVGAQELYEEVKFFYQCENVAFHHFPINYDDANIKYILREI